MEVVGENKNMVKLTKKMKSLMARKGSRMDRRSNPTFGAVSTITTAPVAVGNSMKGTKASVVARSGDSIRVVGRDYAFTPAGSGDEKGWINVGGFPLTPACFVSSALRAYTQIYNKYKFNSLAVHYITSSPTSSSGDVLFSISKNRSDPPADPSSATFLNYALSDPNTIIGPQWTNHTAVVKPTGPFRVLNLGQNNDIDYQSQGELFIFSKTAQTDSPGYIIIDYDITFTEMSVNPHAGLLPNPDLIYIPINMYSATTTGNYTCTTPSSGLGGIIWCNITNAQAPMDLFATPTYKVGNVYKIILTNVKTATYGSATSANYLTEYVGNNVTAFSITEGLVVYGVARSTSALVLHANVTAAFASCSNTASIQVLTSPVTTTTIGALASYIGNIATPQSRQQ